MSNIAAAFAVLTENSDDVKMLVNQLGGVGGTIKAMPAILRIAATYAKHTTPANDDNHVVKVLYYNDETMERVKAFQKTHGLEADGIVGNQTWSEVESLIKHES